MNHEGSTFGCGCAVALDVVFCAKELDSLAQEDKENSSFFAMFEGQWYQYKFSGAWTAIAMATIKPTGKDRTVVAVSPGGAYFEAQPRSKEESNGQIKTATGSLRSMAAIDDEIYACGMARSVLLRKKTGVWEEIGPGQTKKDAGSVVGFEDLAGFSKDEMYAVGWGGEIWQWGKGKWKQRKSPSTANLYAVCCAADGHVYTVGDNGVMLKGRNDKWDVLQTGQSANLMDVAFYNKTVYVVSDHEIFKLKKDKLVKEEAFAKPTDRPATCLHLLTSPECIVSLGTKDLFILGQKTWERLV